MRARLQSGAVRSARDARQLQYVVAVGTASSPRNTRPNTGRWTTYISEAAQRFGRPEAWVRAVMQAESGGAADATSPAGAIGLMQIMPETYAELRVRYGLGANAYDPHDNIIAGTAYMSEMIELFGVPNFLAAYNAGPARFDDYLQRGRLLPDETRRYLARIGELPPMAPGVRRHAGRPITPCRARCIRMCGGQSRGRTTATSPRHP